MELDFKLVLETFTDAVVASDGSDRILYVNQAVERLLGWKKEELLGQPLTVLMPARLRQAHEHGFRRFLATHEPRIIGKPIRVPALHRDGREIDIELALSAFKVHGEDLIVASLRDLRDRVELERQVNARALAEASEARSRFLAEAGAALAESLDYAATLSKVVRLAIPEMADWCTVVVEDAEGGGPHVAVAHRDPAKLVLARRYEEQLPRSPPPSIHTPILVPEVTDADLVAGALGREHLRLMRALGISSCIRAPMVAHKKQLGVISLVRSEPGHPYGAADLATALELASRAALAIQNARLFEAEQKARMRAIQLGETLPDMAWTASPEGHWTWSNRRWMTYTGQAQEESLGSGWKVALHPDEVERCTQAWGEAVLGRKDYEAEHRIRRASDRAYRWHLIRAMPVRGPAGSVLEWVGTCTDIHDKKHDEESARFLAESSAILGASLDYEKTLTSVTYLAVPRMADWCSVELLDESGVARPLALAHVDPSKVTWAKEMRGRFPPDPNAPRGTYQVIRTGKAELYSEIPDELMSGTARDAEHLRLLHEVGMQSAMVVPLTARGRTLGAITFVAAESGRRYEARDLSVAQALADRAAQAVDNVLLYHEAQEAVRARDEFLSVASHELRTPLTPLQLNVQAMQRSVQDGAGAMTSAQFFKKLDTVGRQVRRLQRLVNTLLDVSRVSSNRLTLEYEDVDLSALAAEVLERFEVQATEGGTPLSLKVDGAVRGSWDRLRLDQILVNLVSNALKFANERPVELTVAGDAEVAKVTVHDSGIGIALEDQERIFGRFERAVSIRHYGGLGLGLWLSRQFAEAMGGTIQVQSAQGEGSTFTVVLPKHPPQARASVPPGAQGARPPPS